MTDIVERLRSLKPPQWDESISLRREAADTIERLEAVLRDIKRLLSSWTPPVYAVPKEPPPSEDVRGTSWHGGWGKPR
jgi:hypothetical protein